MHHFHKIKTTKVSRETNDCVHIAFEIPEHLKHEFSFKQGQYLNVRFVFGEEGGKYVQLCGLHDTMCAVVGSGWGVVVIVAAI